MICNEKIEELHNYCSQCGKFASAFKKFNDLLDCLYIGGIPSDIADGMYDFSLTLQFKDGMVNAIANVQLKEYLR